MGYVSQALHSYTHLVPIKIIIHEGVCVEGVCFCLFVCLFVCFIGKQLFYSSFL